MTPRVGARTEWIKLRDRKRQRQRNYKETIGQAKGRMGVLERSKFSITGSA